MAPTARTPILLVVIGVLSAVALAVAIRTGTVKSSALPAHPTYSPAEVPEEEAFEAVLRIDEEPGFKRFQGVYLHRDDGELWVIDYRARGCWTPFAGKRVRVVGQRYEPERRPRGGQHFRVDELMVFPDETTEFMRVGPMREYVGTFVQRVPTDGPEGGEPITVFSGDGPWYRLANPGVAEDETGRVRIKARVVERPPSGAQRAELEIYVLSVELEG